jgi:heat shock protein HslJ
MMRTQSSHLRVASFGRHAVSALRYAVIGLALLAMAWPSAPPSAPAGLAGSAWRIVEVSGAPAPVAGTLRFTMTSIRGKAPCNSFFGAFRESEGAIEIAGINETGHVCSGRMELERAMLDALAQARSYRLDGGMLVLIDAAGKALARLSG